MGSLSPRLSADRGAPRCVYVTDRGIYRDCLLLGATLSFAVSDTHEHFAVAISGVMHSDLSVDRSRMPANAAAAARMCLTLAASKRSGGTSIFGDQCRLDRFDHDLPSPLGDLAKCTRRRRAFSERAAAFLFSSLQRPRKFAIRYRRYLLGADWCLCCGNSRLARPSTYLLGHRFYALAAIVAAFLFEQSFSPYSHYHARYFPVLITLVLGTVVVLRDAWAPQEQIWMRPQFLAILIFLSVAQMAADGAATWRWGEYIMDLQTPTLDTGDARRDYNWKMQVSWDLPIMSILFAKDGVVKSMIDPPAGSSFRPAGPQKPDELSKLPGIDHRPYIEALTAPKRERGTLTAQLHGRTHP